MLEFGFNALDNDFITLWSREIVSGETSVIFEDLTKLAELGQINAIQSWYLFAEKKDDNAVIDNNVKNLGRCGANELLAKANYDFYKNDRWRQLCQWYKRRKQSMSRQVEDYEVCGCDYIRKGKSATEAYYNQYKQTNSMLMLERFYEMMNGRSVIHKAIYDIYQSPSKIEFNKLRKALLMQYEKNPNNVAVAFALGKNLTLFKANDKLKELGIEILTKLGNRELSPILRNYEIKGRTLANDAKESKLHKNIKDLSAQERHDIAIWNDIAKLRETYDTDYLNSSTTDENKR